MTEPVIYRTGGAEMVEKSHTAEATSFWPGLMEPLRGLGERVAEFFAPAADASATDNVDSGVLTLRTPKPRTATRTPRKIEVRSS
jgi:hypothetical protein